MGRGQQETPILRLLTSNSGLREAVKLGAGALEREHRNRFTKKVLKNIDDSLNLDEALLAAYPESYRWDYLIGHSRARQGSIVVAVEVHPAGSKEVTKVIDKKEAAQKQLQEHLRRGGRIAAWIWVASERGRSASSRMRNASVVSPGRGFSSSPPM
jgi:hypothetical protein